MSVPDPQQKWPAPLDPFVSQVEKPPPMPVYAGIIAASIFVVAVGIAVSIVVVGLAIKVVT